ncbi:MAG: type II secretion system F family protein [Firmicutes bacterium]|nr:type II secretion system F family protein [Bacillota bacterium]
MPIFAYKAKNKKGKITEGQVSAASREKLLDQLRKEELSPIDIREITDQQLGEQIKQKKKERAEKEDKKGAFAKIFTKGGIPEEARAFFTRQFTTMLNAGLTIDKIISVLYKQTKNQRLKQVLYQLGEDLQKGSSIHDAMSKHKDVFDDMYLSMVTVGEASGSLPTIFERLATIIEKNMAILRKLRSATAYPLFILAFSAILSYVLIAVFLPNFIPIFQSVGVDIEHQYPLTAFLIKMSKILTNPLGIAAAAIVIILAGIAFKQGLKIYSFRKFTDGIILRIPAFSNLIIQSEMSRFSRSFSYLTSSGVSVLEALEMLGKGSGNIIVREAIYRIYNKVREGQSLVSSFEKEQIFPEMVVQMIGVGEESGSISEMMEKASIYLDEEVDTAVTALTSMMEPAMMILVGLIVGVFIYGILVPILSLATQIQK